MKAEITYNAGASYRFVSSPIKFLKNRMQIVENSAIIDRALVTKGFTVRVLETEAPKPPRVMRPVETQHEVGSHIVRPKKKKIRVARKYDD